MAMLLIRISFAVGSAVLVSHWPFPALPILWALLIWAAPRAVRDRREIRRLRALREVPVSRISELESELAAMRAINVVLLNQIRELQESAASASASRSGSTSAHPVFRKVGLDQNCPKWVAEIVRREYRKRLHPDTKEPNQKAEAERRFKQMEEVFGEIWRLRRF